MTNVNGKEVKSVGLYARVSTLDKGQDPEMQLRELREHCAAKGLTIASEYIDKGVSGSKESRPQLNRLMEAAKSREFDAVLCWKIDRFGRSTKHLVNAIADLDKWGACFISLKDNIDFSTPAGRMMFHVIAAMAQFERELIRERVLAGLEHARSKGTRLGSKRREDVDPEQIGRLRSAGLSWREIAKTTGLPRQTCYRNCPTNLAESALSR